MKIRSITLAIPDALFHLTPNAQWTMTDINDYGTLIWNDDTQTKPTLEECQAMFTQIKNEKYMEMIRLKRNILLNKTDIYMTPDYPHPNPEIKQLWSDYRVALRDLPATIEDPSNPVWPVPPADLDEVSLEITYVFNDYQAQEPSIDEDINVT
jgi:hypothetical protein